MEERSVRIAFVLASATAAGAFGGCIAYGVGFMNGTAGLEGFRWLVSEQPCHFSKSVNLTTILMDAC